MNKPKDLETQISEDILVGDFTRKQDVRGKGRAVWSHVWRAKLVGTRKGEDESLVGQGLRDQVLSQKGCGQLFHQEDDF